MTTRLVSFESYEDLSSRLVLMPRIEDEGRGAVVASFDPTPQYGNHNNNINNNNSDSTAIQKQGINSIRIISKVSSDSTECRDEKEVNNNNDTNNNTPTATATTTSLVGCVLVGSLKDADFATILSSMRGQPGPIVLELMEPTPIAACTENGDTNLRLAKSSSSSSSAAAAASGSGESDVEDDASSTASDSEDEESSHEEGHGEAHSKSSTTTTTTTINNNNNNTLTPTGGALLGVRWGAWGSRMRVAAEAASSVAVQSIKEAAANRAAKSTDAACANQEAPPCGLHVQTSLGAFLPLSLPRSSNNNNNNNGHRSSEMTVTISSVLYIRRSAVEPCPPRGFSFQWFKGLPNLTKDSSLEEDWVEIPGATSAAFQPSTTEIGYLILCKVTVESDSSLMDSDSESDDSDTDDDNDNIKPKQTEIRCITPQVVAADLSLFNGAKQALVRGAHFGGMVGMGRAQGRCFRVQVEAGQQDKKKKRTSLNSVKVEQVSGETAAQLHAEPLRHVTARSCHMNSKALELQFRPCDLLDEANLLSALVSDEDGTLELVAPNRFARESLLLAIGISNFKGKPSDLDATTILYPPAGTDYEDDMIDEESSSCVSGDGSSFSGSEASEGESKVSSSCASSVDHGPRPQVVQNLALSPATSSNDKERPRSGSMSSHDSASADGDLSTIASEFGAGPMSSRTLASQQTEESVGPTDREVDLEQEVAFLRAKLAKKDKVVSELQRQVTRTDTALQQANQHASQSHQKMLALESQVQSSKRSQKKAEQMVQEYSANMKKVKEEHSSQMSSLKQQVETQRDTIADLEKTVKSHQNEKAVLSAAIEARESKLGKMSELQESYVALSSKVSEQDQWRKELEETSQRYQELKMDLQNVTQAEKRCRRELESTKETLVGVQKELTGTKDDASARKAELKDVLAKNQKLKSERNSYKQKADSLSKEISRICRNGRTLADVESILTNDETRQEEVLLLRKQKRKALEDCHSYRKSYEQNRAAQEIIAFTASSPKGKKKTDANQSALLMERNVELERVVTELTEYVNAKEMQLETMKQVTAALQEELHLLAQANMDRNEV